MPGTIDPKLQHIKRRKPKDVFEAIRNGNRGYEVLANTPDLSLDVDDIITFQEMDPNGAITGRAFTKKVLYKEPLSELKSVLSAEASGADIGHHDYAILGLAEVRYRTLKSIYDYALTFHVAVDIKEDTPWAYIEGPYCAPPLVAPDLLEQGILNGINLARWPPGRYSISLMVRIKTAEPGQPLQFEVVDLLVLTLVRDAALEAKYGGLMFEELDSIAILDGRTININGVAVTPLPVPEIDAFLQTEEERRAQQNEALYNETFGSIYGDGDEGDGT